MFFQLPLSTSFNAIIYFHSFCLANISPGQVPAEINSQKFSSSEVSAEIILHHIIECSCLSTQVSAMVVPEQRPETTLQINLGFL